MLAEQTLTQNSVPD